MRYNSLKISGPINYQMSKKDLKSIYEIVVSENNYTIIGKLDLELFSKFVNIITRSNKIFLFLLKSENRIIGYSIYSMRPKYLISEMKPLKFKILNRLIKKLCLIDILNLIIKTLKIFNFIQQKAKQIKLDSNFNLSYLAIHKNFQSKGFGEIFIKKNVLILKKKFNMKYLSTDAKNPKTVKFYIKKCKFKNYSYKVELFKIHRILFKKV